MNTIERIENFYEVKNIDEGGNVRFYNDKSISLSGFEKEYFWVSKEELSDFADYLEEYLLGRNEMSEDEYSGIMWINNGGA